MKLATMTRTNHGAAVPMPQRAVCVRCGEPTSRYKDYCDRCVINLRVGCTPIVDEKAGG